MFKKYVFFSIASVCSIVLIFIIMIFGYIIPEFEYNFIERKKEMIKELVNSACEIVKKYEQDVLNGKLTQTQAETLADELINKLRYGPELKDYFWVINTNGLYISHPYRTDLNKKYYSQIPDKAEREIVEKMIDIVNKYGSGYVEYKWQRLDDTSHIVPKIAYVKKTKSWGWLIGTGVHIYDIREEVGRIKKEIIYVSLFISFLITFILFIFLKEYLKKEKLRAIAEEEMRRARAAAEEANMAKSMFLTNMSHEIRTPMNGIIGFANLLASTRLDNFQKEYIEIIQYSSNHLLYLINDILDFAKIETGRMSFDRSDFDMRNLVERTAGFFSPQINKKKLIMKTSYECGSDYLVCGDEIRIKQILVNLIGNAIKFTQNGNVEVNVKEIERSDNGVVMQIAVKDTGIGISEDKIEKIFESFYQIENSFTKRYQGTGLGLAIVKGMVEQMKGTIKVKSETGKGSEFIVTFAFGITLKNITNESRSAQTKDAVINEENGQINILLAEDDEASQKLIKYIIEKYGWKIEIIADGNEALNKLNSKKYDILLLDINMPGLNGLNLLDIIKSNPDFPNYNLPVIVISAYAQKELIEKVLASGADDFITKPIYEKDLSDIIFKLVNSILTSKK